MFDSLGLSIESRGDRGMDCSVGEEVGMKIDRLFRYNNKNSTYSHVNKNQKISLKSTINNQKSITINITNQQHNNLQ